MVSLLLEALLAMAGTPGTSSFSKKLLIIEFRGGGRAGLGDIRGDAKPRYLPGFEIFPENPYNLLAQCGLHEFTLSFNYHFVTAYARSSDRDVEIIACFKGKSYASFNAGWGQLNASGLPTIQTDEPFRKFWEVQKK